jgi:hypothetical protein
VSGYATSADGKAWKRMSGKPVLASEEPWEKVAVMPPHVMWDEATKQCRMWYSGGGQGEPYRGQETFCNSSAVWPLIPSASPRR